MIKNLKSFRFLMFWGFLFGQTCIAGAQVTALLDAGSWRAVQAVSGTSHACSMHSSYPDGRIIFIHFNPDGEMLMQLSSPAWRMRNGASIRFDVQFDELRLRNMNSTVIYMSDSPAALLQASIDTRQMDSFIEDFIRSSQLSVIFRTGNERDWIFDLDGSAAVSEAFIQCVERMPTTTQP